MLGDDRPLFGLSLWKIPSLLATLGSPGYSLSRALSLRGSADWGSASSTLGGTEAGEEDSGALSSIGVSKLEGGVRAAEVEGGVVRAAESFVGGGEVLVDDLDIRSGEVSVDFVVDW